MNTLIKIGGLALAATIVLTLVHVSSAQDKKAGGTHEMVIEKSFDVDDLFMLPELSAGIIQDGETIKFDLMPPADNFPRSTKMLISFRATSLS